MRAFFTNIWGFIFGFWNGISYHQDLRQFKDKGTGMTTPVNGYIARRNHPCHVTFCLHAPKRRLSVHLATYGYFFSLLEICLLTNAKRVASVRAETYCNLFSLSVEHFNAVLEHYPVMRRTMESVAAERLNKIGKNPSIVSNRAELEEDINTVNELIMQTTPIASSGSELSLADRAAEAERLNEKERREREQRENGAETTGMKKSKSDCYVGGTKEDRISLV